MGCEINRVDPLFRKNYWVCCDQHVKKKNEIGKKPEKWQVHHIQQGSNFVLWNIYVCVCKSIWSNSKTFLLWVI